MLVGESLSRSILRSPIIVMLFLGCLSSISQIAICRLLMKVSGSTWVAVYINDGMRGIVLLFVLMYLEYDR